MEQQGISVVKARLVGQEEDGAYTTYVFENLDKGTLVMLTRVPNWKGKAPVLLQEGYVEYKFVTGGKDSYYDTQLGRDRKYQYTNHYFLDFVPITHVLKDGYVVAKNDNTLKIS